MDLTANLPLTEATFFILLSLAEEPRHGYSIMKDVVALSNGRVALSTGTLYGALKRLLAQGWIERLPQPDRDGRRERKSYRLTGRGRAILEAETERLERLATVARRRITGVD